MARLEIVTRKDGTSYIRGVPERHAHTVDMQKAVTAALGGWVSRPCRGGVEYVWSQTATTNELAINPKERR